MPRNFAHSSCCAQSCPTLATRRTAACQAPLSMGFSRQEYCNGLPFPSPGDLPSPGIEPMSLVSPALAGGLDSLLLRHLGSLDITEQFHLISTPEIFKTSDQCNQLQEIHKKTFCFIIKISCSKILFDSFAFVLYEFLIIQPLNNNILSKLSMISWLSPKH